MNSNKHEISKFMSKTQISLAEELLYFLNASGFFNEEVKVIDLIDALASCELMLVHGNQAANAYQHIIRKEI